MTETYQKALAKVTEEGRVYQRAVERYRAGILHDEAYLRIRAKYQQAQRDFDIAFAEEAARGASE
jgi:hypothetical protein